MKYKIPAIIEVEAESQDEAEILSNRFVILQAQYPIYLNQHQIKVYKKEEKGAQTPT